MATLFNSKDIENLVLQCDYEDDNNYKDPVDMIGPSGNKNYAYVTLIMLGDRYVPAAIVLAQSLRKLNTKADLVVLVTNDVSEQAQNVLLTYFDHVINITYIHVRNWRTKKQSHRKYLDFVFTKFHLFNLVQYKKILLIDADAIVLKYPDHLFSLNAPAGCYLKDKDLFITYDKLGNYVLPSNLKIKWYNEYCDCCGHGKLIPKSDTDDVILNRHNSGIGGGLMLLEPKKGELEEIIKDVTHGKGWDLVSNKFVWPEQQYLTYRYSGKWTGINPRFFGLQGYPHWKVLYGLQYGGDKPFFHDSKFPIETRIQYPDYVLWHDIFREILNANPTFVNEKCLEEALKMNSHFAKNNNMSRIKYNNYINVTNANNIANTLNINNKLVHENQVKYFHLNTTKDYNNLKIKPLFEDINEYDFLTPIVNLDKYFSKSKSAYYNDLLKRIINEKSKKKLNDWNISEDDKDSVVTNYIQSRESIFILTVWPYGVKYMDDLIKFLEENGNVYYHKTYKLNYNGIKNLMFTMYDEFTKEGRNDFIKKKLSYSGIKQDNEFGVIVFDNVKNKKIGGQNAEFKQAIRSFIINKIKQNDNLNTKDELRGNDVIHVNDFFYQSINYAQILFNKNSMNVLEKINMDRHLNQELSKGSILINTFKKFIYENLTQLEIMRTCLMGGSIFYSYGIRLNTDIDGIIINTYLNNENEKTLEKLINENFIDKNTKFHFADIGIEDSKHWRESWTEKNKQFLDILKVDSFSEVILNPKYHYYSNGLKHYIIDIEIIRKFLRFRPEDYADFVMLYLKFKNQIQNKITLNENMTLKLPDYAKDKKIISYSNDVSDDTLKLIHKKYMKNDYSDITKNVIKEILGL